MSSWSSFSDTVYHSGQINPRLVLDLPYGFLPVKVVAGGDVYLSALEKADYSDKGRDTEDLSYTYNTSLDSFGGYADFSISPTDELGISAGARYDTARVKAEKKAADLDETVWHRALVYNGALRYNPSAESKVYLKGGTIFRYPFIDEQSSLTGFFGAEELYTDIKPETGWEIEAGGSIFTGKAFSSSASVYLLLIEDEIAYNPDEGRSTNLDDTRRLGGDIELSLNPVKQVGADISYSYVQAAFASGDNEGNTIPLVPAHTVRGSLRLMPFQSLNIEPAFSFVSEAYQGGDNENSEELVDSYWLADLVIRYQLPVEYDLRIVLRCENLLDEVYAPYVYWDKYSHAYYPAAGRSLTLGVTYSY